MRKIIIHAADTPADMDVGEKSGVSMVYAQHFSSEEFRDWPDDMSPRLVTMLDILRYQTGSPIVISPHPDSLGRELAIHEESAHNITRWGEVLAADFFVPHISTRGAVEGLVYAMRNIGFTGIGVYTDTVYSGEPLTMFHGDVRPTRDMGAPAEWGRVNGQYVSVMKAIQSVAP